MIRKPYDPQMRVQREYPGATRTQQNMRDEVNVNTILRKYTRTGLITHLSRQPGAYLNLPDQMDFQDAWHLVHQAHEDFDRLPSDLRKRFDNDPGKFLAFMHDPANREEAVKLGLIPAEAAPPEPMAVRVVNPEAPVEGGGPSGPAAPPAGGAGRPKGA